MTILQLSAHFKPNIGGVETHLWDLVNTLAKHKYSVIVLTYRPLTTKAKWKTYESSNGVSIIRIPWLPRLFYTFVHYPILEFLYLLPGLFIALPFVLLMKNPKVIHAHGLVAGFVGVFWGRIFGKRVVISTHSIYSFPKQGLYKKFVKWIFNNADCCLGLSDQASVEIKSLGIASEKVNAFTYWIDLNNFHKIANAKNKLGWNEKFVILFVGRLIPEKGLDFLLKAVRIWDKEIRLKIIGSGPMENKVQEAISGLKNVEYIGSISQRSLPLYYSGSDILIIPSTSEEGFGRVILESLACGTPVIGANRGAIPEVLDATVGKLIDVSDENIKQAVEYFYSHKDKLNELAKNCRKFAERRFSEKNVNKIIQAYTQ